MPVEADPIKKLEMRCGGSMWGGHAWALHVTREPTESDLEKIIAFLRERQEAVREPALPF